MKKHGQILREIMKEKECSIPMMEIAMSLSHSEMYELLTAIKISEENIFYLTGILGVSDDLFPEIDDLDMVVTLEEECLSIIANELGFNVSIQASELKKRIRSIRDLAITRIQDERKIHPN